MKTIVYTLPNSINNNSLDINKIRFSDIPYKKLCKEATEEFKKDTFVYFIDMYYKNDSLIIQLPKYRIESIDQDKIIININEELMNYLIKPLEEHITNIVHLKSEQLFNGKKFTMNKIMNSLISPSIKINDNNYTLKLTLNKNTLYFNRYKNIINKEDIKENLDIICLIKVANLQFLHNKFSYNLVLEQAKIFIDEYLVEYSIIDENENTKINSKISDSISSNETCEQYQSIIDSDKHDFF